MKYLDRNSYFLDFCFEDDDPLSLLFGISNGIIFTANIFFPFHHIFTYFITLPPPPSSPLPAMSTPLEYYRSLPPVSKLYGVACLMTTAAYHLGLYDVWNIALLYEKVFMQFQIWRLITNFFFLGPFSLPFAFDILIIARYGVSLERGPFDKRTADYVWMFIFGALSLLVISIIPFLKSSFLGTSLVFMIAYIWGREFPNERISVYGLVTLKGFYLPWLYLALDLLLGNSIKPGIRGIMAGHLFYFLTVLYPLSGGKYVFKTPLWVHKVVAYWGEGAQLNAPVRRDPDAGVAFRGRSFRLNGTRTRTPAQPQSDTPEQQPNPATGAPFSGRSYRLNGR